MTLQLKYFYDSLNIFGILSPGCEPKYFWDLNSGL